MSLRRAVFLLFVAVLACGVDAGTVVDPSQPTETSQATATSAGLTPHFRTWLSANGYARYGFARDDLVNGSFGGKASAADPVVNQPIIFIHGNSDRALGDGTLLNTGWAASRAFFLSKGYTQAELYATTWGPANVLLSGEQYHSKAYLEYLRAFIQAVKAYTGAAKVDIVAHSMGVTLGRKAIEGGPGNDPAAGGSYSLGAALTSSVDTFVGIAGANRGLTSCYLVGGATLTCDAVDGLYPGYMVGAFRPFGPYWVSAFLTGINGTSHDEGSSVYSIWSSADEVVGYGCIVWYQNTCAIPGQNGQASFSTYGHVGSKDLTGYTQWRMVKYHATK